MTDKPLKKYIFTITYQNEHMKRVSDFMSKLDLGSKEYCLQEVYSLTRTDDGKPMSQIQDTLKLAYESCGCIIFDIKGVEQ